MAASRVAAWRGGSAGFFKFLEDVKPLVPSAKGGYEPYIPGPLERAELARALDGEYRTIVLCWPRRHGKTLASALIIVWRFLTRKTQTVATISKHGDATVTTCVIKTVIGEDDHFFVLASDKVTFSSGSGIRRNLTRYAKDHGMTRATLESFNVQDLGAWCADQTFAHELVHPTAERQASTFTALHAAAAEGRLHVHPSFDALLSEMAAFEYRMGDTALPRFEAAKGSHDDHVYSLAWAIYALRDVELNPYEVRGIHCHGTGPAPRLCLLNGGSMTPPCAEACRSMRDAYTLYQRYRARGHLTPLDFSEFVEGKLKNVGAHTMPRAA